MLQSPVLPGPKTKSIKTVHMAQQLAHDAMICISDNSLQEHVCGPLIDVILGVIVAEECWLSRRGLPSRAPRALRDMHCAKTFSPL